MRPLPALFSVLLLASTGPAVAQPAPPETPPSVVPAAISATMYYATEQGATVYTEPEGGGRAYLRLGFREPVFVLSSEGDWSHIRTQDGAQGYVASSALSNVWIRISKRTKSLYVYRGMDLIMEAPADFGYNAVADKERRGSSANPDHWRTPDGSFFVIKKNPHSKFYKALLLNYPNAEDARRGLRRGLISKEQHDAIVQAERDFTSPPMSTALGGMIEIHGDGTGVSSNWTQGCVALHNTHIDKLWAWVEAGTPVIIEK
jgi:lipoprotein-anchoring transpeptidase ErfK/SrfK